MFVCQVNKVQRLVNTPSISNTYIGDICSYLSATAITWPLNAPEDNYVYDLDKHIPCYSRACSTSDRKDHHVD